ASEPRILKPPPSRLAAPLNAARRLRCNARTLELDVPPSRARRARTSITRYCNRRIDAVLPIVLKANSPQGRTRAATRKKSLLRKGYLASRAREAAELAPMTDMGRSGLNCKDRDQAPQDCCVRVWLTRDLSGFCTA